MGRFIKKCKGIAEIAVVELPEIDGGVRKRENEVSAVGKRIREVGEELRSSRRRLFVEATASVPLLDASPTENSNCGFDPSPLCLIKTSGEYSECGGAISVPEAQPENSHLETTSFDGSTGRGRIPNSPLAEQTGTTESTTGRRRTETASRPSESEIDDFFSAAERDLHNRFSQKYNFDVINGVPLKGRYEWVPAGEEWS